MVCDGIFRSAGKERLEFGIVCLIVGEKMGEICEKCGENTICDVQKFVKFVIIWWKRWLCCDLGADEQ